MKELYFLNLNCKLILCEMSNAQKKVYEESFNDILSDRYILDMVLPAYPNGYIYKNDDIYTNYSSAPSSWLKDHGIIFSKKGENKEDDKTKYNFNISGDILKIKNLGKYSGKFVDIYKNILNSLKPDYGSILIYNELINGIGLKLFINILLGNGFDRYDINKSPEQNMNNYSGSTLCIYCGKTNSESKHKDHNYSPAKICLLDGSVLPSDRIKLIGIINDIENKDGKFIKVVLGSGVVRESIDFKRLREVHIMNFQNNFPTIDQIVGRAVRHCSHIGLDKKNQNVHIFKYASVACPVDKCSDNSKDLFKSIEVKKYHEGEQNYIIIKKIENQLKINSFDCPLNGIKNCNSNFNLELRKGDIDTDTFDAYYLSSDVDAIKKLITKLYKENIIYTYEDIVKLIELDLDKNMYSIESFIIALNEMVEKQEIVYNEFNEIGFIMYKYPYYIFQPFYNRNSKISLFDRLTNKDYINDSKNNIYSNTVKINEYISGNIVEKDIDAKIIWKKLSEMPYENYDDIIAIEKYLEQFKLGNQIKILERAIEEYNNDILRDLETKTIIDIILDYYDSYLLFIDDLIENNYSISSSLQSTLETKSKKGKKQGQGDENGKENNIRDNYIVAHILDKMIKCWNPEKRIWDSCEKNKISDFKINKNRAKEIGKWIGYMDKDNKGKIIFKLRPPITENIIKQKDRRKIEQGFVCSQSNDKQRIRDIAQDIGVPRGTLKNGSIKSICYIIENHLRILEKKNKGREKWFYEYIERI